MSNNQIQINNLSFSFSKDTTILNDINLSIVQGEFLTILGASGSGKSTLLRIISNILPASKTEELIGDVSIFGKTPKEYLDTGKLSFMFQEASLMPNLNVRDNIGFPIKLRGKEIESDSINELLDIVGLTEHQNKFPSELSGGMKTRVSLARAFVTKPKLLLLDEPFSALDISWRYELYNYLLRFSKEFNTTVVMVTHDIQEAILLSNIVIVLSKSGSILTQRSLIKNMNYYDYDSVNKVLSLNSDIVFGLQTDILIDTKRSSNTLETSIASLNWILDLIKQGKNEEDPLVIDRLNGIRNYVNDKNVSEKLIKAFIQSESWKFRFEALWPLLDIKELDFKIEQEAFLFIENNRDNFTKEIKEQNYFQPTEVFFKISEKINNPDYPLSKTWLYLNYLHAYTLKTSREDEAKSFINSYLINNPNYKYAAFIKHLLTNQHA